MDNQKNDNLGLAAIIGMGIVAVVSIIANSKHSLKLHHKDTDVDLYRTNNDQGHSGDI